ncbi:MAG: hypothetical protein QM657_06080 [Lacrimispora sp.]|uniref:hypothetical protein n=1 Tax=Lacrimispora sp. TaxID=2719234 RepID=UPI0039E44C1E
MNNEQNLQANDLDSLIGDNHLQMMKAALPYMSVPQQRSFSFFIKFNELRRTINLFEGGEVAAMGLSAPTEREQSDFPIDMLNTIKPFGSPSEQDLIDLMINFMQGFKLAGAFSDAVPGSTIPVQAQSDGQNRSQNHQRQNNNPFGRLSLDQIKNFMPPEQQSRFETMQLMMSAMQQMS